MAIVSLTTVHNWVELVYKAFGQTLPTGAKELALLGVREVVLSGRGDGRETAAAEGTADFSKVQRVSTRSLSEWDDLLFAVWTDSEQEDSQGVDVYQCAIDPKTFGQGADSTPYVLEGILYRGYPGSHSEVKGEVALHVYKNSPGNIRIARLATDSSVFKTLADADTPKRNVEGNFARREFVRDEQNDSIHIHFARKTYNTSLGCTILIHEFDTARYKHFIETFTKAPDNQKKKIPYLVVSSEYVRLYDDWVKQVDGISGTPGPETVIIRDQLRSPKGMTGKYLPSIMTTDFANAVIDTGNAVMRTSLEKALFTV